MSHASYYVTGDDDIYTTHTVSIPWQDDDTTKRYAELPGNASYEDVIATLDKLEADADASNTEMYQTLREIVKGHVEYMQENGIAFVDDEDDELEE